MIPRLIHYCWLSDDPYPEKIRECLESWKRCLVGYEFVKWDATRFPVENVSWVRQAIEMKKYAFAADYIRLYALYNFGGIYLDCDVMVYRSFDDLLSLPYFIGRDFTGSFEPAVVGSEPHNEWIKDVLLYYEERDFLNREGVSQQINLPVVFFNQLFPRYSFNSVEKKEDFINAPGRINLFDHRFFNGRDNVDVRRYRQSYSSHLFTRSWSDDVVSSKVRLMKKLPRFISNPLIGLNYHILRKAKVHKFDPIYRKEQDLGIRN